MTSPAINGGNGQKEGSKSGSTSALGEESSNFRPSPTPLADSERTPPFTAWWRVFKMVNLLMQQGC